MMYFCIWDDFPSRSFDTLQACEDWASKNVPHTYMRVCFYLVSVTSDVTFIGSQSIKKEF